LKKQVGTRRWQYAVLVLGVSVCLIGAFLMWDGSILGERTTGIATVVGIVGIGMISRARARRRET